jgi:hypothetical protein
MSAASSKRTVLFSIRPFYANKILAGQKTVELRRRFPEVGMPGSTAMIYCTNPVRAIVGSAQMCASCRFQCFGSRTVTLRASQKTTLRSISLDKTMASPSF